MNFRNIINSIVIVMTLILCFVYAQKKGFTFASGMPKLNWESFTSEKEPKKNDNLKKEYNDKPKKDEKNGAKPDEAEHAARVRR
jgi:stringent starvation protein B